MNTKEVLHTQIRNNCCHCNTFRFNEPSSGLTL